MKMVRQIIAFWKETWVENKPLFFAEMVGTLSGMTAATMMGFQSPHPNLVVIFIMYNINAVLFIYSNYVRKSSWLMLLMTFYIITNTIGLWRAF